MKDADCPAADTVELAALIASRICHDLTSPLGAVGNGVELLQLARGPAGSELDLVAAAVAQAQMRLRLLRLAFGQAAPGQIVGRTELAALGSDLGQILRPALHWPEGGTATRDELRLAVLLAMCLDSTMPYGGTIAAARAGGEWRLQGRSARMRPLPECWNALARLKAPPGVGAPLVHFAAAAACAAQAHVHLSVVVAPEEIVVSFLFPPAGRSG